MAAAAHREEEAEGGKQHAVDGLLVQALRGAQGPGVEEGAAEEHEHDEAQGAQDAVVLHVPAAGRRGQGAGRRHGAMLSSVVQHTGRRLLSRVMAPCRRAGGVPGTAAAASARQQRVAGTSGQGALQWVLPSG